MRVSAAGAWTPLANQAPGIVYDMQLLPDGTVMGHNASAGSWTATWYKLTPDSNGHYVNGTWSTLAPMHDTRRDYQSQVLRDGRLFVSGGEYGTGSTNCETYDPLSNTWTEQPQPGRDLIDSEAETLPNGNVMVAALGTGEPCLIYDIVANTWSAGAVSIDGQDEAAWVKLGDGSTMTIDPFGTNTERYIPSLNVWIADNPVPTVMYGSGGELGAGFLLPNGKVFYIGGTNHTAIYTPSGTTNAGVWVAGADIPFNANAGTTLGAVDSSAAMMFNGKILCALGTDTNYGSTTFFYEYDYTANSFTQVGSPTGGNSAAITPFTTQMLDLPDGTVLFSYGNAQVYSYQPDGSPVTNGIPTINNVAVNYDGSYTIFGTLLNGISQGAAYGDDKQMDTGRPIAYLTNSSGNVQYCRTLDWSTCDVATGTNVLSTSMTLPSGLANGTYPLVVAANGISSAPYSLTVSGTVTRPPAPTGLAATGGIGVINLAWTQSTGSGIAYNRIYRSVSGSGGPYTLLAMVPATTSYSDASVTAGDSYYYEVGAINATAESAPSTSAGATAQFPPPSGIISINFVGNGTAMGAGESAGVMLASNWNNATGVSGTLSSLEDSGTLVTSASATWSCNDTWALPITDTPGNYRMMRGYLDDTATSTNTVTVSNLSSTYTANGYDIYVYCDGDNASYTRTGGYTIGSTTIDATDLGGTNFSGTFVQAINSAGNYVVFSNETAASFTLSAIPVNTRAPVNGIQIVAHAPPSPPPAPTGLSATGGNTVVNLAWIQSIGTNITGNNVYRSTSGSGGTYNLLANLAATTSYSDTAVVNGNTYFYSVSATNVNGESALSAYAGATPQTSAPPAPTGLTATAISASQINLSWNPSTGATSYNVKRATVNGGPYSNIATEVTTTSYSDTSVSAGTAYYYVVSAVNGGGESANSAQANATTPPPAGATLTWNAGSSSSAQDGSGIWISNGISWLYGGNNFVWSDGDVAAFGVNTTTNCTVTLDNDVTPAGITFNATGGGSYTLASGGGNIDLTGAPVVTANNNATINATLQGTGSLTQSGNSTLSLGAVNTYTGGTTVNGGTLQLTANSGASGTITGTLTINSGAAVTATAANALGYGGSWVRTLNINGATFTTTANGDQGWGVTANLTGGTLTASGSGAHFAVGGGWAVNSSASSVSSVINGEFRLRESNTSNVVVFTVADGPAAVDLQVNGPITQAASGYGIVKAGAGVMALAGTNSYTGTTTISNGTLLVSGSLAAGGAVAVEANGTLGGTGAINNPVTLQGGATLTAGGSSAVGALTISNTLALNVQSTNVMRISKTGGVVTNDSIIGVTGTLSYAGTLMVTNVTSGSHPLAAGDRFKLFRATSYSGAFATIVLPTLSAGLHWDTTKLVVNGSISVVDWPSPTGNWHFNDGSGTTAADSSGNGYNGTLSGNGGATWVTGFSGSAIQFNGTSNWVAFGTGPSVNGTNNFTVTAWIKTTATNQGTIMQQRDPAGYNGEYQLSVNANGTVQFYLYGSGNYQFNFATTNIVNNGAWHQVVGVRNGLAGSIYVDGVLAATASGTAVSSMANTINTAVGRDIRDQNKNFSGIIDEVLEYSTYGFSATDVQTLYNSYF